MTAPPPPVDVVAELLVIEAVLVFVLTEAPEELELEVVMPVPVVALDEVLAVLVLAVGLMTAPPPPVDVVAGLLLVDAELVFLFVEALDELGLVLVGPVALDELGLVVMGLVLVVALDDVPALLAVVVAEVELGEVVTKVVGKLLVLVLMGKGCADVGVEVTLFLGHVIEMVTPTRRQTPAPSCCITEVWRGGTSK
ncbi:MAG: hypothetical protein OHK93_007390 [Ramalina farinacea]|uniref:Uncharacterized protein n=1 Tax=Ramalina farinacea TaxID=258253 RepID=A0AA43TQX4_9LECA|nr:hypothetical protein [Ramalina farinacea]